MLEALGYEVTERLVGYIAAICEVEVEGSELLKRLEAEGEDRKELVVSEAVGPGEIDCKGS